MSRLIKYNLEIMSGIFVVVLLTGFLNWGELSEVRKMTMGFILLYTLHEWEESRFPGGFYRIFFSKCTIAPDISEEKMHVPVAVYLLVLLLTAFIFDNQIVFALIPLVLALFEGFIHTAGVIIHQLKKPYSPGMITAWAMFLYAIAMIFRLQAQSAVTTLEWILGVLLTVCSFLAMETMFMKGAGITVREFQTTMKNHIRGRIQNRIGGNRK